MCCLSYVHCHKHYYTRGKKVVSLWIFDISVEQELINVEYIGVNFNDKLKFENNSIHASKNIIDWIFTDNENKHKNLRHICDDDDDDDDLLNTHNLLTIKEIVYDDNNNNNALNDEEYAFINSKYYSLTNRIKNEYIKKC